jgi:hypothetical protein
MPDTTRIQGLEQNFTRVGYLVHLVNQVARESAVFARLWFSHSLMFTSHEAYERSVNIALDEMTDEFMEEWIRNYENYLDIYPAHRTEFLPHDPNERITFRQIYDVLTT